MDDYKRQGSWKYLDPWTPSSAPSPLPAPRVRTAKMLGGEDERGMSCRLSGSHFSARDARLQSCLAGTCWAAGWSVARQLRPEGKHTGVYGYAGMSTCVQGEAPSRSSS